MIRFFSKFGLTWSNHEGSLFETIEESVQVFPTLEKSFVLEDEQYEWINVCVWEREREREIERVFVSQYIHTSAWIGKLRED
jgi:hypothetical protein